MKVSTLEKVEFTPCTLTMESKADFDFVLYCFDSIAIDSQRAGVNRDRAKEIAELLREFAGV